MLYFIIANKGVILESFERLTKRLTEKILINKYADKIYLKEWNRDCLKMIKCFSSGLTL